LKIESDEEYNMLQLPQVRATLKATLVMTGTQAPVKSQLNQVVTVT